MNAIAAHYKRLVARFRSALARFVFADVPMIWTANGNVPIADLEHYVQWSFRQNEVEFREIYKDRASGAIVKESGHVRKLTGQQMGAQQAQVG